MFRKGCLAVCFLLWRLFDCSSTTAAAATSSCTSSSMVSEVTLGPFLGFLCYVLDTKLGGGLLFRMCFDKGVWLFVSCFGGCLIAAAPQQHHSSSSSHQQLHQQQAAAGSSRQQQAAGSCRQQAAAGSSRQQHAAADTSRGVSGTKLGGVLLFRMCFEKGVWLCLSCFGGSLTSSSSRAVCGDWIGFDF